LTGTLEELMAEHEEHESSLGFYVAIWITLMVCTGITVWAAFLDLHQFNAAVALIIATFKATLVVLFFMHLRGASDKLIKVWVVASIFFMLVLIALSMADFGTRLWS
jgi:cytochrome c oxidase subunit IV